MSCFLYENHWGSPTLILLNVLGVLGVLNVLYVLHVLHVLHGRIVGLLGLVHMIFVKNTITLSNRFRVFLPCFRSLNVLYKHLDGLGLLLGSLIKGQSKKKDSESLTSLHN